MWFLDAIHLLRLLGVLLLLLGVLFWLGGWVNKKMHDPPSAQPVAPIEGIIPTAKTVADSLVLAAPLAQDICNHALAEEPNI